MKVQYSTEEKISRAKIQLQLEKPFWARLILSLIIKKADNAELPNGAAAGVDPKGNMIYSEEYFSKLDEEDIKYILAHEVSHLCLGHMLRVGSRDKVRWNMACDLVINTMLNKDGFKKPKEGLIPDSKHSFDMNGQLLENLDKKAAEDVYDEMKETKDNEEFYAQNQLDQHTFEDGMGEGEKQKLEQQWKQATIDAANYAKHIGSTTGAFETIIKELLDPKVPWTYMLNKYLTDAMIADYTFMKRSKKSLAVGIYLPKIKKENIEVYVHIDTSGSIDQQLLTEFVTEIVAIARSFENVKMTVIECDCTIKQVLEVSNGNIDKIMEMKIKGGGGTSHKPVWKYIEENSENCKVLVSLTDGYSDISKEDEPGYDVIFALPKNHQKPVFGEKMVMEG